MEKFIPYEKLSKREKKRLDAMRRGSWGGLNPVTRRPDNPRAYNRARQRKNDRESGRFFVDRKAGVVRNQISARCRSSHSQPVRVNALKSVVSMTVLEVRTPSWPMFRAMT